MRFSDQIKMALASLWRRKLRSGLTILGVVIGTVAIVVMLSIGIAQKQFMEEAIGSSRELQEVSVYSMGMPPRFGGPDDGTKKLDDEAVAEISALPHVEYVSPVLRIDTIFSLGAYQNSQGIEAYSRRYIDDLHWNFEVGTFPSPEEYEEGALPLVIGKQFNYNFYNPKSRDMWMGGFWSDDPNQEQPPPPVNMYEEPVFAIFDTDAYWQTQYPNQGSEGDNSQPVKAPKKYLLKADGIIATGNMGYSEFDYSAYTDIEAAKTFLNSVFRGKAWPGQPATKTGRATGQIIYDQLRVKSDSIDETMNLAKTIQDLGYQANSSAEYIQQMQETSARTQTMLGGIGGISLLVATIGIANTMMMAIYERTKEIGIYKVLGCNLSTIRNLFLLESGMIGFIGGVLGLGLSYLVSYVLNNVLGQGDSGGMALGMIGGGPGHANSIIPPWLAFAALAFSILIGMLAGLLPALRAMRLSPLEAIRTE